jgi:uncharacterized membrane protein
VSAPRTPPTPRELALQSQTDADRQVDLVIGRLLQIGVFAAAAIVALGAILFLAQHGASRAEFAAFVPGPPTLRTVGGILRGALAFDSAAIVQLGLVLLIMTPIARVLFTLVAFIIQRDRLYILITSVVLALLLYGLIAGV